MSIILKGKKLEIPGLKTLSWVDAGSGVAQAKHGTPRRTWIKAIVLHTIHGKSGKLLPGNGPATNDALVQARYQANTDSSVSWDYTIGYDGTVICSNDPFERFTWQATCVNGHTVGIELVQEADGDLYEGQLEAAVRFLDFLTLKLGVQRQIPFFAEKPDTRVLKRLRSTGEGGDGREGGDMIGLYGHRSQTNNRGKGDPGDFIFQALEAAHYEKFDFAGEQDLLVWKDRQSRLGLKADGVPGPTTRMHLKKSGHAHGLWVPRPIDALVPDELDISSIV